MEDNIREWTGLEFGKSQRAAENREKWRKLVAKSSVVPHRPSRGQGINDDGGNCVLSQAHESELRGYLVYVLIVKYLCHRF